MPGMTIKQHYRYEYLLACRALAVMRRDGVSPEDRVRFIALSVYVHGLKGHVPRRFWPMANLTAEIEGKENV